MPLALSIKKILKSFNFQKINFIIQSIIFVIVISTLSCTPPNVPKNINDDFNNPNDPNSKNFVKPTVQIISGPSEGVRLFTRTATFAWSGNNVAKMFSWRLDTSQWSDWSIDTTLILNYMDDDLHKFIVRARHENNVSISDITDPLSIRNFTVDILQSPALFIVPNTIERNLQNQFYVVLRMKQVSSLLSAHVTLKYDKSKIQILSAVADTFLARNYGQPVLIEDNNIVNGTIDLNFGVGLGNPKGVFGTGSLIKLRVKGVSAGATFISILQDSILVLDTLRQKIIIKQIDSCNVIIK